MSASREHLAARMPFLMRRMRKLREETKNRRVSPISGDYLHGRAFLESAEHPKCCVAIIHDNRAEATFRSQRERSRSAVRLSMSDRPSREYWWPRSQGSPRVSRRAHATLILSFPITKASADPIIRESGTPEIRGREKTSGSLQTPLSWSTRVK